jgi:hypothetical protein
MAEDEENTWFIPKWGAYEYNNATPLLYAMLFSIDDALLHPKWWLGKTSEMYLDDFIQVFLDDFIVYEQKRDYLKQL